MEHIVSEYEKLSLNINDKALAIHFDECDPLKEHRSKFIIPQVTDNSSTPQLTDNSSPSQVSDNSTNAKKDAIYMLGNSLGLQPKSTRSYIDEELKKWEDHGVEAYFIKKNGWFHYDEKCTSQMAELVGAKPIEIAFMASLTANLHFLMASFYTPTTTRFKILMEDGAFPADAVS